MVVSRDVMGCGAMWCGVVVQCTVVEQRGVEAWCAAVCRAEATWCDVPWWCDVVERRSVTRCGAMCRDAATVWCGAM